MIDPDLDPQAAALLEELDSGVAPPSSTLSVATGRELLEDLFAVEDPEPVGAITDLEIRSGTGPFGPRISRSVTAPTGSGSSTAKRSSSSSRPVATDSVEDGGATPDSRSSRRAAACGSRSGSRSGRVMVGDPCKGR